MTQRPADTCPFCGFSTQGRISGHLQLECIRALASELRALRDSACQTAQELFLLKARLARVAEPPPPSHAPPPLEQTV
jgi:hypothetical protein